MRRAFALTAVLLVVSAFACARARPPAPAPEPARRFVQDRAWRDLEQLAAIGARPSGSEGAEVARAHVRAELEKLGVEVRELSLELPAEAASAEPAASPRHVVHLVGVIPGESRDVVLLGASYDGPDEAGPAADAAASAPALVLELARAIAARPLPYTTWVAFLDGDFGGGSPERRAGSGAFARQLALDGTLQQIRMAFLFRRVAAADLRLQRDLLSHRMYREALWRAASRSGALAAFPSDAGFTTPAGPHLSLFQVGARRVVLLAGAGEAVPPEEDTLERCSPESLATVGQVSLDALDDIAATLVKVDRLAPGGRRSGDAADAEEPSSAGDGAARSGTE
jgi:hypothetical protein